MISTMEPPRDLREDPRSLVPLDGQREQRHAPSPPRRVAYGLQDLSSPPFDRRIHSQSSSGAPTYRPRPDHRRDAFAALATEREQRRRLRPTEQPGAPWRESFDHLVEPRQSHIETPLFPLFASPTPFPTGWQPAFPDPQSVAQAPMPAGWHPYTGSSIADQYIAEAQFPVRWQHFRPSPVTSPSSDEPLGNANAGRGMPDNEQGVYSYMSAPSYAERQNLRIDPTPTLFYNGSQNPSNSLLGHPKSLRSTRSCVICRENFSIDDNTFPHKCASCTSGASVDICKTCLKDWFLRACRDESQMPPKCCTRTIPLTSVLDLLTNDQVELYREKFEEWETVNRLYCPVPTCSAFIPPRLYLRQGSGSRDTYHGDYASFRSSTSGAASAEVKCPKCLTLVCTSCRSFSHSEECLGSDLDLEVDAQLKQWNFRRCPKCRSGINKVSGCVHIKCRCGAEFCFTCLKRWGICDGTCPDIALQEEAVVFAGAGGIDGNARYRERNGHDFGRESVGQPVQQENHRWTQVQQLNPRVPPNSAPPPTCNVCSRLTRITVPVGARSTPYINDVGARWPLNRHQEPAWQCFTGHLRCETCPRFPYEGTDSSDYDVKCACGMTCEDCVAIKQKTEMDSAWGCQCGMIVCGACRDVAPTGAHAPREQQAIRRRGRFELTPAAQWFTAPPPTTTANPFPYTMQYGGFF